MRKLSTRITGLALACGLMLATTQSGLAATNSAPIQVQASITNNCILENPTNSEAMTYDPVVANRTTDLQDSNASIQVLCTTGATATVGLEGANDAGGYHYAVGLNSSGLLQYQTYSNPGFSTLWGPVTGTDIVSVEGNGTDQTLTIYISAPAGQNTLVQDTYTDTLTATVDF